MIVAARSEMFSYFLVLTISLHLLPKVRSDDWKPTSDVIRSRGFDVAAFDVISQNYNLRVYRIINPLADPKTVHKTPVVCSHGIMLDSVNMMSGSKNARPRKPKLDERVTLYFMENGTDDRGIHFYLSNNNYDVWLIEARGSNDQSKIRISDRGNKKPFWDFSLDDQALIDLPLQIDFVLNFTQQEKISYISYSQSTTLMFMLLAMRPEYSDKLANFIALAPVVFTTHMKSVLYPLTQFRVYFQGSSTVASFPEWFRKSLNLLTTNACSISYIKNTLCHWFWIILGGPDKNAQLEGGLVDGVMKSTSFKTFEQYVTNGEKNQFRMYDYLDDELNMKAYGQTIPPLYDIGRINLTKIVLFRGTNDYLSDPMDQMILIDTLRVNLFEDHILQGYSHIDFIASASVTIDVNEPVLRILDKTTNRTVRWVSHTLGEPSSLMEGIPLRLEAKKEAELLCKRHCSQGSPTKCA